jgi:hypothetical protein
MASRHTVRQIRYRVNEFSGPPSDYEVFFTEAGKRAVSDNSVWEFTSRTGTPTLSLQYARRRQACVESSGTESRVPSWSDLVVGYRLAKRLVRGHVRSGFAGGRA